jgi:hypothetical protein
MLSFWKAPTSQREHVSGLIDELIDSKEIIPIVLKIRSIRLSADPLI